ncbi:3,4-dioxygenase subunit beta [Kibdelosporangium philippinense]|uniref:3,4-dioxygenase subunit beta n=2 Tax=Kibdelosporangium philippinense TaxID=211113 RepID=A0ABS8ZLL5_9PSEU|nr:3,4-dioxygenase subunit beta [Kibdelosporangium philippinense]MCE7008038.1 3,4-dioxygenase subunit beta [Kibdelosporangium philippinense]
MTEPELTYEGRRLPRPHDEVVDQGLSFDLGTLFDRRRALRLLGLGAAGAAVAACSPSPGPSQSPGSSQSSSPGPGSAPSNTLTEIPEETGGPYPGDGSNGPDVLEQSGVVRSDIRSSFGASNGTAQGVPMTLELVVADLARGGSPFAGVAVYVWQCDREGRYSMYTRGAENQNYLRGVQIADATGRVRFTSIFPACYPGRWPRVHFEMYPDQASITDADNAIATSQVALPKNACDAVYAQPGYGQSVAALQRVSLTSDDVFRDDTNGLQLGTVTGDVTSGYNVLLNVGVDTRT